MSRTEPIKSLKEIQDLKNYFLERKEFRNYTMITIGMNTALRISDILKLKWESVYNFEQNTYYKHIYIRETKTGKSTCVGINQSTIAALEYYKSSISKLNGDDYIIKSRKTPNRAISRNHAYTIIKNAAQTLHMEGKISCHSLRKTFGYQAWKKGTPPALLMSIYNHSSMDITKIYLSIDQDDKDEVFFNINL